MSSDHPAPGADPLVDQQFIALLERIRAGDTNASTELYNKYNEIVLIIVRRRLNPRVRQVMDSIDIAQDVWKSFFHDVFQGDRFANPEELLRWLASICRNKVLKWNRDYLDSQKRSLYRTDSMEQHADEILNRPGREEDPGQRAQTEDEWASMLRNRPERVRLVVQGLRGEKNLDEIARELQISVKTVPRIIEDFRNRS